MSRRALAGATLAAAVFLLVQLGALALVPSFYDAGYQTVENPQDPTNSGLYVLAILLVTGLMLGAFRYDLDRVVRAVILATSGLLSWYVLGIVVPAVVETIAGTATAATVGPPLALGLAALVPLALWWYPEWYVLDAAGVIMGAGAAALFGISFGLLPALVLLAALAVYDAVSVYGTEHMLDLADGVMDLRIPVVLVIPLSTSYSFLEEAGSDATDESSDVEAGTSEPTAPDGGPGSESGASQAGADPPDSRDRPEATRRGAFFIGLGDAVMPTVMVASAAFFSPAPSLGVAVLPALNLPALLGMVGTFAGLAVLLRWVLRGRAHAGLPLLNGGAIGGYLIGSVLAGVPLATALGI